MWRRGLSPGLPELVEIGAGQILRGHGDAEFDICLESQEPWLRQGRKIRRFLDVHDKNAAALAVQIGKIDGLGFDLFEYGLHFRSDRPIAHGAVEWLQWKNDVHEHAHGRPPTFSPSKPSRDARPCRKRDPKTRSIFRQQSNAPRP